MQRKKPEKAKDKNDANKIEHKRTASNDEVIMKR